MKFINIVRKIICSVFIVIILICCFIGLLFQKRAEDYLHYTRDNYGIFLRKRIKYTPFVIFYIKGRHDINYRKQYAKYIECPYIEKGMMEGYIFNHTYGAYLMYCFYTIEEMEEMDCSLPNDN